MVATKFRSIETNFGGVRPSSGAAACEYTTPAIARTTANSPDCCARGRAHSDPTDEMKAMPEWGTSPVFRNLGALASLPECTLAAQFAGKDAGAPRRCTQPTKVCVFGSLFLLTAWRNAAMSGCEISSIP